MTAPISKRADQLGVGDRILEESLPFRFSGGHAEVVFVAHEDTELPWVFVAYRHPNGQHDSWTVRPDALLQVIPADTGPVHFGAVVDEGGHAAAVEVAGGLIEIDPPKGFAPASAPKLIRCGCGPEHGPQCTEQRGPFR